jgi:glutaredoxin
MKLLQISTTTCPPCKRAKDYIEKTYNAEEINYDYQTLDKEPSQQAYELYQLLGINKVPHFVVLSTDGKILDDINGFNPNFVTNYVNNFKENSGEIYVGDAIQDLDYEEE